MVIVIKSWMENTDMTNNFFGEHINCNQLIYNPNNVTKWSNKKAPTN